MLDSIKSINLVSAYSAKGFKDGRDLSEIKDLFKTKAKENGKEIENYLNKKTDSVEISEDALKLLNSSKETE